MPSTATFCVTISSGTARFFATCKVWICVLLIQCHRHKLSFVSLPFPERLVSLANLKVQIAHRLDRKTEMLAQLTGRDGERPQGVAQEFQIALSFQPRIEWR